MSEKMSELVNKIFDDSKKLVSDIGKGVPHTELHERAFRLFNNSLELHDLQNSNLKRETRIARQNKLRDKDISHGLANLADTKEVERVTNKLKRWAKMPDQLNHKILRKYLELKKRGETDITPEILCDELMIDGFPGVNKFYSNFAQMKSDAPKSHGKIFVIIDDFIEIWDPVAEAVDIFKKSVIG